MPVVQSVLLSLSERHAPKGRLCAAGTRKAPPCRGNGLRHRHFLRSPLCCAPRNDRGGRAGCFFAGGCMDLGCKPHFPSRLTPRRKAAPISYLISLIPAPRPLQGQFSPRKKFSPTNRQRPGKTRKNGFTIFPVCVRLYSEDDGVMSPRRRELFEKAAFCRILSTLGGNANGKH